MSLSTSVLQRASTVAARRSSKKLAAAATFGTLGDLTMNAWVREAETGFARQAAGVASNYPVEHLHVVGLDEAGVGALAGPIVAAAVYIPHNVVVPGLLDSKQLSDADRREVFDSLAQHPLVQMHCAIESPEMINQIGHLTVAHMNALATAYMGLDATLTPTLTEQYGFELRNVMLRTAVQGKALHDSNAVARLQKEDFHPVVAAIVDGAHAPPSMMRADSHFGCIPVVKADGSCPAVAAASIVAKVLRDNLMAGYHSKFPGYGFKVHKGYGTNSHLKAIAKRGPCAIHRVAGDLLRAASQARPDDSCVEMEY